jgi:hypothetical protein
MVNKTYNSKGTRTFVEHKNKWSLWATKVKTIAVSIMTKKRTDAIATRDNGSGSTEDRNAEYNLGMEDLLGACWLDQSIELKSMNVVFCNGELHPLECRRER